MTPVLRRASLRHLLRHPWQAGLSVLGIALGVAVVLAIDLAIGSARRAFTLSTEAVAGRATHHIVAGPGGIPDSVYRELRVGLGLVDAAPVVEAYVGLAARGRTAPAAGRASSGGGSSTVEAAPGARVFHLLGVDPFAERPFRPYLGPPGGGDVPFTALLVVPGAILLARETARELGVAVGDTLTLGVAGESHPVILAGTLRPADEVSRRALADVVLTDVSSAQELLGSSGRLTRIDLVLPPGRAGTAALARIRRALPAGLVVEPAAARAGAMLQMTRAFDLNLTALSLLALIFGMFLIYNTMTFSVVQRRPLIGTLRALGVTRREVFALLLGEALVIGLVGTAIGLALGVLLGQGLVRLITRTLNDLYFVVSVRGVTLTPLAVLEALALGIGATILAALPPAHEATTAPPRAVLSRAHLEARARRAAPRAALAGTGLLGLGFLLLALSGRSVLGSFAGLFVLILGVALLTPLATLLLARLARPVLGRTAGMIGRMAAGGVAATLSRTAPAVAALAIAVSVGVAVGTMVQSFRGSVVRWLDGTLRADIYVSAPGLGATRSEGTIDPGLMRTLIAAPGVARWSSNRSVTVPAPAGPTRVVALRLPASAGGAFRMKSGDPAAAWRAFRQNGGVLVTEPFAYRRHLAPGGSVRLWTDRGPHDFPVAGVFYDYSSDQGVVFMSRLTYDAFWNDRGTSSLGLYAAPGVDVDGLVRRLRARAAGGQAVLIRSNRGLRAASLRVFDRTFAITSVLRLLALIVAFVGVLSALMALQLERAREIGVLRATGLTVTQVWALVSTETGLIGLAAGLLALPFGLLMAAVMIFVVNRRSFGWTLEMRVAPMLLLQAVAVALVAALLAGIYPALRMARTPPAAALRQE